MTRLGTDRSPAAVHEEPERADADLRDAQTDGRAPRDVERAGTIPLERGHLLERAEREGRHADWASVREDSEEEARDDGDERTWTPGMRGVFERGAQFKPRDGCTAMIGCTWRRSGLFLGRTGVCWRRYVEDFHDLLHEVSICGHVYVAEKWQMGGCGGYAQGRGRLALPV
jgi:hypothetical protein